ncbi:MAG TPA: type I-U CRISPR-associated protein Csb2 [Opitutaceae bacterium]|nr:type I-U CRISPR-associated protein Csb2 [Opitutaceae bacterium]
MIALGVRYLTGYAAATNLARQNAEWPPHPGRVFMAMAAAHFETGEDPAERAALEWLETAPPPALRASGADERSPVRAYVPVNDETGGIDKRPRQDRAFPRVRPYEDSVFLIWNASPEPSLRSALDRICRKVTRIGHSSSAVQMWIVPEGQEPAPNLTPGADAYDYRLRVASPGTMRSLVDSFNRAAIEEFERINDSLADATGKEKGRLKKELTEKFGGERPAYRRPQLHRWAGYGKPESDTREPVIDGPFDADFIVLAQEDGSALGLEPTLRLTSALRNAAMKAAGEQVPEWLSGHDENGNATRRPHVAFFPLPYVGFDFADGHVMGMAMALPKGLGEAGHATELRRVLGNLLFNPETGEDRTISLWSNPETWRLTFCRETRERPPVSLRRQTWTGPAWEWGSVTPVVLHHYPKKNREGDVERIVREAFVSAGFPEPREIAVHSVSHHVGAGHAKSMPPFTDGGPELCRYQVHVCATFTQSLRGPMLVGRGRFRGYGLFRPMWKKEAQ